jgi:hypothetical protein
MDGVRFFSVYPTIWQGRWLRIITKQCLSGH